MIIRDDSKNYFFFQLDDNEIENSYAKDMIIKLKLYIPHGSRLWYKDLKGWKIHKNYFDTFVDLYVKYLRRIINNQGKLPF